jgi:hypothetical protein
VSDKSGDSKKEARQAFMAHLGLVGLCEVLASGKDGEGKKEQNISSDKPCYVWLVGKKDSQMSDCSSSELP